MTVHPSKAAQPVQLGETIDKANFSEESLEVLEHFGYEAPKLLNDYCCAVEDALIEQVQTVNQLKDMLRIMVAAGQAEGIDLMATIQKAKANV